MAKLLEKYRADRSTQNAVALRNYNSKHPMAACMLTVEDGKLLNEALEKAGV